MIVEILIGLAAGLIGGWWLKENYDEFTAYAKKHPSNTAFLEYLGLFGKEKKQ